MRSSTPQFLSKALVLLVLVCVGGPVRALAQDPATGNLNAISSVNVRGATVEIVGTKKPNFTTFTLTDPPRLVIDISEAIFNGVAEDIAVNNGTVTAIRTASYGSDESAIARVLIGYEREVETDIQARGNALVVSVAGASGGEAVAATSAGTGTGTTGTGSASTGTTGTTGTGTGTASTGTTGTTGTGTGTASTGTTGTGTGSASTGTGTAPAAQGSATAQAQPSDEERLRQAAQAARAAQEEQKQQQLATAQAAQQARADAEAQRQAQARAEAERKAQEESTRAAQAQAERERTQQAEQQRAQAQREAQAAEKQRQQETARAEAETRRESAAQAVENRKRQVAEERARREEEAQAAADARRQQAEDKQRQQQEEKQRQQEARQTRVAQAQTPAPVERGESSGPPSVSSRRKTMTLVGFRQESAASRVFVRTDEPVRYSISKGSNEVVVELENTRITDDNNTLPLDTSFFNTSVASVAARPGPSRTVRVSIRLKQQVPYQTRQEGNELLIDFQRPARR